MSDQEQIPDPEHWLKVAAEALAKADRMRTARHMDRRALERHLSGLSADLAVGAKYIGQQRQIVAQLQEGHRAVAARQLLQEAEENQAIFVAEADRLAKELLRT